MKIIQTTMGRCKAVNNDHGQCDLPDGHENKWHARSAAQQVHQWRDETPDEAFAREAAEKYAREGPHPLKYAGQHPAEATLDYLIDWSRTNSEGSYRVREIAQTYFDWKARNNVGEKNKTDCDYAADNIALRKGQDGDARYAAQLRKRIFRLSTFVESMRESITKSINKMTGNRETAYGELMVIEGILRAALSTGAGAGGYCNCAASRILHERTCASLANDANGEK